MKKFELHKELTKMKVDAAITLNGVCVNGRDVIVNDKGLAKFNGRSFRYSTAIEFLLTLESVRI
jgi:hypothetical protein